MCGNVASPVSCVLFFICVHSRCTQCVMCVITSDGGLVIYCVVTSAQVHMTGVCSCVCRTTI